MVLPGAPPVLRTGGQPACGQPPQQVAQLELQAGDRGDALQELRLGQLLPAIERALDGLGVGAQRSLTLKARDAYGRRDPKAVLEVDRSEFPPDVAPGDRFEVENEEGAVLVLQVLDVGPETVHLDLNHPLAGQDLRVELSVVGVRPATSEELEAAERALEASEAEGAVGPKVQPPPLVPLESLLRGPGRGYERGRAGS